MTVSLWREDELASLLGAPSAPMPEAATGVAIDSRTLQRGDLFVAIRGDSLDGHDYVARAFASGASAAIVEVDRAGELAAHGPAFAVDDTLRALQILGVAARRRATARIAAVTGSVGKTSVKEMLRTALSACGPTHASLASFNNHWGVPLTLARLPAQAEYAVFEIGMNHAGEITPLVGFVRPHVAIVTTIAPVHIEYLGSLAAIGDAKAEIFSGVEPGGVAVVNAAAPEFERLGAVALSRELDVRAFGPGGYAELKYLEAHDDSSRVVARLGRRDVEFSLGAPGRHMAENAIGALVVVEALGADVEIAARALAGFAPQKGRGERATLHAADGAFTLIDESYNANPASMRAALALLGMARPGAGGRRIAIVGDMLELGSEGPAMHAALADELEANQVDLVFAAGPLSRRLYDAAPPSRRGAWSERAADLETALRQTLRAGDVAMIKASNGSRMGPLALALRQHFAAIEKRG